MNLKIITKKYEKTLNTLFFKFLKRSKLILEYVILKINIQIAKLDLLKQLKDKNLSFIYVFDVSTSSIGYGDFLISIFFLRYVSLKKKIKFIFIQDKVREDAKARYKSYEIARRLKEFSDVVNFICQNNCKIEKISWDKFLSKYKRNNNIYLKKFVLNKKPIYKINFNLLNNIFPKLEKKIQNKILFKKKDIFKLKIQKKKLNNYIAVGIRMDYPNENSRNHNKSSIKQFIKYIRNKKINKNKKILLISDKKNSIKLKQIFKFEKNIYFSKNYTKSFLEDGFCVLSCDYYYQYYGTGISVFAEFSKIKFEIFTDLKRGFLTKDVIRTDQLYSSTKKNSWQTNYQKFIDIS